MDAQRLDLGLDPLGVPQQQIALLTRRSISAYPVGLVGAHVLDPDPHRPQRIEVLLAVAAVPAGVDVILDVTVDVPHVFQCFGGVLDEADEALDRDALFIAQHLAK